ncbi:MAG: hypothetical protein IH857_00935 [Deltaproteobacteria bacterium]|nr:hypothetical protein [Deltaproteobacteria bacterium]MCZ6623927.1 hypothetical protein [Deltaproteobacteria bacterium]
MLAQVLLRPRQFTPGLLVASFPPLIVGVVKLITVLAVSRGRLAEEVDARSRLWVTFVFLGFHLLTASAAIAVLARFFL